MSASMPHALWRVCDLCECMCACCACVCVCMRLRVCVCWSHMHRGACAPSKHPMALTMKVE